MAQARSGRPRNHGRLIGASVTSAVALLVFFGLAAMNVLEVSIALAGAAVVIGGSYLGLEVWERLGLSVSEDVPPRVELTSAGARSGEIAEVLPMPVIVLDREGRVVIANARARQQLNVTGLGALVSTVIREPLVLEAIAEVEAGASVRWAPYREVTPRERFMRAYVARVPGDEGRVLVALNDETAERIAERVRVNFLANASHELRTPLASLAGFIETLQGHAHDDEAARDRFLGIMQDQAARMRRLIDDLLQLSRAELNQHIRPRGGADLQALSADVIDALQPVARERGVRLIIENGAERLRVRGDRDELIQAVQNVVENAVKYSPDNGEVRLTSRIWRGVDASLLTDEHFPQDAGRLTILNPREPDRLFASISVSDGGPGVPREHLPHLSNRFFRAPSPDGVERIGTGLGLAIVKHILTRHRGGLVVESVQGRGTRFSLFVPCIEEKTTSAPGAATNAEATAGDAPIVTNMS